MFSSLDRVDIVATGVYIQTDHRTANEIKQEPELSILFAVVRVLNPLRGNEDPAQNPVVVYVAREPPPAFLCQAIRAAGGQIAVDVAGEFRAAPLDEGEGEGEEPPPLEVVIDAAFAGLAQRVAAEHGVELTRDGLATVEQALADVAGDPEQDELTYWSSVMKLGSFGGELIRTKNGGEWRAVDSGTLPIALATVYQGEEATVNPLGKAIKRFANGDEDSLVGLVDILCRQP